MATADLDQILAQSGLAPTLASELITAGWTRASFAMCASNPAELDNHWDDLFPDQGLSFLQKAQLRVAWQSCRDLDNAEGSGTVEASAPATASLAMEPASSWSETFAPKLSSSVVAAMKAKFLSSGALR